MNLYPLSLVRGAGHSIPEANKLVGFKVRGTFHAVYDLTSRKFTAWPLHWHRLSLPSRLTLREAIAFFESHCGLNLSCSDHAQRRAESGYAQ